MEPRKGADSLRPTIFPSPLDLYAHVLVLVPFEQPSLEFLCSRSMLERFVFVATYYLANGGSPKPFAFRTRTLIPPS